MVGNGIEKLSTQRSRLLANRDSLNIICRISFIDRIRKIQERYNLDAYETKPSEITNLAATGRSFSTASCLKTKRICNEDNSKTVEIGCGCLVVINFYDFSINKSRWMYV